MPVRNNGPGGYSRASTTRKSKIEPEYPQWAESKMRAIENRRLKELQAVVRDSMPEMLAIAADEMDTASESIRKDGYSDMVRRIQNRFRIMRDRLSRRLKTDPLERDVRRCADYTDRRQLQEWQRSVRATLGIDISKDFFIGERYEQMLSRWAEQNVSFITSIESDCFDDMEKIIIDGFMDDENKKTCTTMDDDTTVEPDKQTADDGEGASPAASSLDPVGIEAAIKAYLAATGGATADDENDPAAGGDPTKPTEDDGEDDATTPDVLADITARRDAMEDGPAKSDINTLLSMLEAEKARADAAEDDAKQPPTEDEDDTSDDGNGQLNHDSLDAIVKKKVAQRTELCRLGDRLHLDGMETLPVMQAKKKVIRAVLPGMRLDGRSGAYINAAFDIAKEKVNGRKTVSDQRRQVFNADSANAATRNANAKNDPDAARTRMIQRHAGEKED